MKSSDARDRASVGMLKRQSDGTPMLDDNGKETVEYLFENWHCRRQDKAGAEVLARNMGQEQASIECTFEFFANPATRAINATHFIFWRGIRHDIKYIITPEKRNTEPESIIFYCTRSFV